MKRLLLSLGAVLGLSAALVPAFSADRSIGYPELRRALDAPEPPLIVDVRTKEEYDAGHVPGALLFPYDQIEARKADFEKAAGRSGGRALVVYCRSGRRSAIAADTLNRLGWKDVRDLGGLENWKGPLER